MTYQGIVSGARSMLFYGYLSPDIYDANGHVFCIEQYPHLVDASRRMNQELITLEPALLAKGGSEVVNASSRDIRSLIRQVQGKGYVFVINNSDDDLAFTLDLSAHCSKTRYTSVKTVFDGDADAALQTGLVLAGRLPSHEVSVYMLE
jgi:hypothetical protein